jgi:hypothetical protein
MNGQASALFAAIDAAISDWRQGDLALDAKLSFVHLADLARPITQEASETAQSQLGLDGTDADIGAVFSGTPGLVVLTQTCDIIRVCQDRPYIEVAPLVEVTPVVLEEVRRMRRPAFAYVPGVANQNLVVHIERTMTIEKAVLAQWTRIPGCQTDEDAKLFALALSRKRMRFAFPNDFVQAIEALQRRLRDRHNKNHAEGAHLRALNEIRIRAAPSWNSTTVQLALWFIWDVDPIEAVPDWHKWVQNWAALFDQSGRYSIEFAIPCRLEDLTARDYVESDHLDLDQLSVPR